MMTVIVVRNVPDRVRGFLASCMLEIAPEVYVAPQMTVAIRTRVWAVMEKWFDEIIKGSIVMIWTDNQEPSGLGLKFRGWPPMEILDCDGILLSHKK